VFQYVHGWLWPRKLSFGHFSEIFFVSHNPLVDANPSAATRVAGLMTQLSALPSQFDHCQTIVYDRDQRDLNLEIISSLTPINGKITDASLIHRPWFTKRPYSVQQMRWTQPLCVERRELGGASSGSGW